MSSRDGGKKKPLKAPKKGEKVSDRLCDSNFLNLTKMFSSFLGFGRDRHGVQEETTRGGEKVEGAGR